jgi:mannose-6-phosphate isomerase
MTIALTPFTGFCGFRPLPEISHFLSTVPELSSLLGPAAQSFQESFSKSPMEGKSALKTSFTALMTSKPDDIAAQAELLIDRAKNSGDLGGDKQLAQLLVELDLQFPKDVGLFCAFFLNYVKLEPGEAMFLRANDVHAYVSGGFPFLNRSLTQIASSVWLHPIMLYERDLRQSSRTSLLLRVC